MDADQKNYEIAFLLSPAIAEQDVLVNAGKISALIENQKGIVRHAEKPRLRALAYPIKKQNRAYFGWTAFTLAPESVTGLKKSLDDPAIGLLRFLIMVEEKAAMRAKARAPSAMPPRRAPFGTAAPRQIPEEKTPLNLEALDKRLEEILGK